VLLLGRRAQVIWGLAALIVELSLWALLGGVRPELLLLATIVLVLGASSSRVVTGEAPESVPALEPAKLKIVRLFLAFLLIPCLLFAAFELPDTTQRSAAAKAPERYKVDTDEARWFGPLRVDQVLVEDYRILGFRLRPAMVFIDIEGPQSHRWTFTLRLPPEDRPDAPIKIRYPVTSELIDADPAPAAAAIDRIFIDEEADGAKLRVWLEAAMKSPRKPR